MLHQPILPNSPLTRITVLQGQARVSAGPRVEFTTVLGSCVAACFYDPLIEVGGMNHFLLAEPTRAGENRADEHYGVYLMELLINDMLANGASKQRLKARLYGGANLHAGMARIGTMNAEFARKFLVAENIPLVHEDLGGIHARRVDFRPATGQVRCRAAANASPPPPAPKPVASSISPSRGDVELF